jgi:hypothetical protein
MDGEIAPILEGVKAYFGTCVQFTRNPIQFMSVLPNFLRSLVLTILLCFVAPILVVTLLLAAFAALSYIPGFETIGQTSTTQLFKFLTVFGSGCAIEGVIVISCTCSLVGALFDTYAFYRYQSLNDH